MPKLYGLTCGWLTGHAGGFVGLVRTLRGAVTEVRAVTDRMGARAALTHTAARGSA